MPELFDRMGQSFASNPATGFNTFLGELARMEEPALQGVTLSLEEERRAAVLKRVECELDLGQHADLVGELGNLLAQYPLDEAFIAYQMTALYGSGRAGEALSLFRDTRSQLIDEQGTEPGPVLTELHQRILSHDPKLASGVTGPGRQLSRTAQPDTLPPEMIEFVGRNELVILWSPEPIRNCTVGEQIFASTRCRNV